MPSHPQRTAVVYANDHNIGDHLSAHGIAHQLPRTVTMVPFERQWHYLRRSLRGYGPNDLVIVGGGGLLKANFDRFWRFFLDLTEKQSFPFALWGVGYCDVKGEATRGDEQLLRRVVERSIASSFRDQRSHAPFADFAHTQRVLCPSIPYVEHLAGSTTQLTGTILRVDHPDLLATLGPDTADRVRALVDDLARRESRTVQATDNLLPDRDRRPPFIASRQGPTRRGRRRAAAGARSLLTTYAGTDLVVTSRLHGAILGRALGKPVVALSADHKIDQFFEHIGESDRVTTSLDGFEAALADPGLFTAPDQAAIAGAQTDNDAFAQFLDGRWSGR